MRKKLQKKCVNRTAHEKARATTSPWSPGPNNAGLGYRRPPQARVRCVSPHEARLHTDAFTESRLGLSSEAATCALSLSLSLSLPPPTPSLWASAASTTLRQVARPSSVFSPATSTHQVFPPLLLASCVRNQHPNPNLKAIWLFPLIDDTY